MSLLDAALEFASQAQPVFPVRPGLKVPATVNGFKDATTDRKIITAWWTECPDFNLGLPTGIRFDVIDIDGFDGLAAMEEWYASTFTRYMEPTVLTPSGGVHIYVAPTGAGNRAGMIEHVDYRGAGGYVLAPPSKTEKGSYRWA